MTWNELMLSHQTLFHSHNESTDFTVEFSQQIRRRVMRSVAICIRFKRHVMIHWSNSNGTRVRFPFFNLILCTIANEVFLIDGVRPVCVNEWVAVRRLVSMSVPRQWHANYNYQKHKQATVTKERRRESLFCFTFTWFVYRHIDSFSKPAEGQHIVSHTYMIGP